MRQRKKRGNSHKKPIAPQSHSQPHITVRPKTEGQEEFWEAMDIARLVICDGCSGTGKSLLSAAKGVDMILNGEIDRMIISRPCVDASSRGIGFLPGDLKEKVQPYMIPIIEEIKKAIGGPNAKEITDRLFLEGRIKIEPLEFLRGRNFHKTFMVLDEASNCTFEQLVMFATRMGEGSKCVISGDYKQTDLTRHGDRIDDFSRFTEMMDKVEYEEDDDIIVCSMGAEDVVRDAIVTKILVRCGYQ